MNDTGQLIESLAGSAAPVKPSRPAWLFAQWLGLSILYILILVIAHFGLRADLPARLADALFMSESLMLCAVALSGGASAVLLGFPDIAQRGWVQYLPLAAVAALAFILLLEWLREPPGTPNPGHGLECTACITLLAFFPAFWLMRLLKRQASTHLERAGSMALIASFALGALALRLSEDTDSMAHLLLWHYIPMTFCALLGLWFGKKILKW